MARKNKLRTKVQELSPSQSLKKVKDLLKERRRMHKGDLIPGNLVFTFYNAKDKEQTYDRTPLVLILKRNGSHTLGLNFHWIPLSMRLNLIKAIIQMNAKEIKRGEPLRFSYEDLKPMLKSMGYAPCIRLYINKRLSGTGVVIPPERLMEVARLKTETFTKGRYSASQLFQMARRRGRGRK
jgi:hypothetical protein